MAPCEEEEAEAEEEEEEEMMMMKSDDGSFPILKLHSWNDTPLPILSFKAACLSPSRHFLLLHSHQEEAVLMPLHVSSPSPSFHLTDSPFLTPSALRLRSFSSPISIPSSEMGTPYFTPSLSLSCTAAKNMNTESPPATPHIEPMLFPFISSVLSFAWGCPQDDYGTIRPLFDDLLFVVRTDGLFIHGFLVDEQQESELQASAGGGSQNEIRKGEWRNWSSHKCGPAETLETPGRKVEEMHGIGCNRNEQVRKMDSSADFVTYSFDAELERCTNYVELKFKKTSFWPQTAKVISYNILYDSSNFFYLCAFCQDHSNKVSAKDPVVVSPDSNVVRPQHLGPYEFSALFSSSSHDLLGMFLQKRGQDEVAEKAHLSVKHEFIMLCRVFARGLKWVSVVDVGKLRMEGGDPSWAAFVLAGDNLFGLQEKGYIFVWTSENGKLMASIDLMKHFGFDIKIKPPRNSDYNEMKKAHNEMNRGIRSLDQLNTNILEEEASKASEEDAYLRNMTEKSELQSGKSSNVVNTFRQMLVTADSLLIAVTDTRGLVYLVSTQEYFVKPLHSSLGLGSSSWGIAGCDIGTQRLSFLHHHWLQMSAREDLRDADRKNNNVRNLEIRTQDSINGKCSTSETVSLQMGSGRQFSSSCFSGFVNRTILSRSGLRSTNFRRDTHHPLRQIFIPPGFNNVDAAISLNPFAITQMVNLERSHQKFRLTINLLHISGEACDDGTLDVKSNPYTSGYIRLDREVKGHFIGFCFQGYLHIVSSRAIYVILPPLPHRDCKLVNLQRRWWLTGNNLEYLPGDCEKSLDLVNKGMLLNDWQVEVLDRALIYDDLQEAERLSLENGWSLQLVRLRRLQLALAYTRLDEIEQALEALEHVGVSEVGIPRLLFSALELMLDHFGGDNELSQAARVLAVAARFATKLVRQFGMEGQRQRYEEDSSALKDDYSGQLGKRRPFTRLLEMARFLEAIRNLQDRLQSRRRRPIPRQKSLSDKAALFFLEGTQKSLFLTEYDERDEIDVALESEPLAPNGAEERPLQQLSLSNDFTSSKGFETGSSWELVQSGSSDEQYSSGSRLLESPKEMFLRWEKGKLDIPGIVQDALRAGRLPLAVVQLHHLYSKHQIKQPHPENVFKEVQEAGRAIVYELFCKGDTTRAMAAIRRLGEDIETVLRELTFGTVNRFLRAQVLKELQKLNCLGYRDTQLLDIVSLLEKIHPSSSFWGTYGAHQRLLLASSISEEHLESDGILQLTCYMNPVGKLIIDCGDIDGVVIGSWNFSNTLENAYSGYVGTSEGYWAGAVIWMNIWDQHTLDKVVLDQSFCIEGYNSWEARLEYESLRHNWREVSQLLNSIPPSVLQDGEVHICLDCDDSVELFDPLTECPSSRIKHSDSKTWSSLDVDAVEIILPRIKILAVKNAYKYTGWMWQMVEEKLARNFVFVRTYYHGTQELVSLIAQAGLLFGTREKTPDSSKFVDQFGFVKSSHYITVQKDAVGAIYELIVRHCVRRSLPNLMQLFLDHHALAVDDLSAVIMQAVVGDCQWALWLLLIRIKGREYDASFANARAILAPNVSPEAVAEGLEIDELLPTIDDIAEAGGELMALSMLMYAPVTLQKCICTGSVNRLDGASWQCTLENLRPGLQRYPTLWRTLVAACFGQDIRRSTMSKVAKAGLNSYLEWREKLFTSASGDASLLLMLPRWLPKCIHRLVELAVQGPVGGGQTYFHNNADQGLQHSRTRLVELNPLTWEAALQKNIKDELYASSFEEDEMGVEHHLRKGRALAAFNRLLLLRAQNANFQGSMIREHVGRFQRGQMHLSSEMQALLAPVAENEEKLVAGILPLAIMHYDSPVIVAACASFLELCGLPAHVLRVDAAALGRIAEFHKAAGKVDSRKTNASLNSGTTDWVNIVDVTMSLARALADEYIKTEVSILRGKTHISSSDIQAFKTRPPKAFLEVLQQLENASLMEINGEHPTAGSWLLNGFGDGSKLRAQQREASDCWSLVTNFCHAHQLQISTVYLAALARDNDWVGFLAEAQLEGCPIDLLISVATKDFTDPRLQSHILIVLKGLQSAWQKPETAVLLQPLVGGLQSRNASSILPLDLFEVLAECERENKPGKALLTRAKNLRWPLLAIIASCFTDVTSLSCLIVWLEIIAARETTSIKVNDAAAHIATRVGQAVEATNALPTSSRAVDSRYNRKNVKRQRLALSDKTDMKLGAMNDIHDSRSRNAESPSTILNNPTQPQTESSSDPDQKLQQLSEGAIFLEGGDEQECLSKMVAILCEQQRFSPLLKAFELFAPSSSLLPFIRFLQAFSQMQLSEATAHLTTFSMRLKEGQHQLYTTQNKSAKNAAAWIGAAAISAADAMLSSCPSAYERHCLLELLSTAEFGDGGAAMLRYRCLYWKNQLTEPAFQQGLDLGMPATDIDDQVLLSVLEKFGKWEEARTWANQLAISGKTYSMVHHVTETQAEAMVAEWKEYLWDLPEQRMALWNHCHSLFIKHSFPPSQAGAFFQKHADNLENEVPSSELHAILLLAMQWLSGSMTQTPPACSQDQLRELETRVWLLAVESENEVLEIKGQVHALPVHASLASELSQEATPGKGTNLSPIDKTANAVALIENHLKNPRFWPAEESKDTGDSHMRRSPYIIPTVIPKSRRKTRFGQHKKAYDSTTKGQTESNFVGMTDERKTDERIPKVSLDEISAVEDTATNWEERIGEQELERAVLSLLEVGQISAAKQLQHKIAPLRAPLELQLVEAAYSIAMLSESNVRGPVMYSLLPSAAVQSLQSANIISDLKTDAPFQVLGQITKACQEGCGRGLCKRITAVAHIAKFLDLPFAEAYAKHPTQLLQLLSLKAQDALPEAEELIKTHALPAASIARILVESFLKGLLAAHRGGYMESSQREEGPAPLMWRPSDFLEWAKLCPSKSELGHALMRLVISGLDMPHACEAELLILAHHFYMASACLDGIDVLLALAATRVESFVAEGDFPALARLVTGIGNFQALHFILDVVIENGQLELLLQKQAAVDAAMESSTSAQGFQMAVLSTLKHFSPHDLDTFATVYNYFHMKHEMAALLESKSHKGLEQWILRHDPEQSEELLETMRYDVEATEIYASIDAGNKARWCSAQASLVSLQLRMPEIMWLNLTETNARRLLVEQSRFQEAFVVAEAYGLNQPAEWVPVLWNQMLHPGWIDQFLGEFVAALPLPANMLMELSRFYRAEVTARGNQLDFSKWLTPGGLPLEWARYLGKSFRCLLKYVRDVRLRIQLATLATGFSDVIDVCQRILDKVPDTAGPLILRKGHGGTYLPLM